MFDNERYKLDHVKKSNFEDVDDALLHLKEETNNCTGGVKGKDIESELLSLVEKIELKRSGRSNNRTPIMNIDLLNDKPKGGSSYVEPPIN